MSRDDERIDFTALDPSRDALRWERMIRSTAARAVALRRGPTVADQLVRWARPAIAIAASVALVAGGFAYVRHDGARSTDANPASQLLAWAHAGEVADPGALLSLLGGSDDR